MSIQAARMNWKNFFNLMVGRPKIYDVKIERDEEAKKYPLISIKKDGDVGYDLPSTRDMIIKAPNADQITSYKNYMYIIKDFEKSIINEELKPDPDYNKIEYYKKQIEYNYNRAIQLLPRTVIPTGIRIEMPDNVWCTICARSSSSAKMLITPDSIIDSGYRGEIFAVVFNIGYTDVVINAGDRVCQLIFHERVIVNLKEVDKVGNSERGVNGFGSTGR